MDTARRLDIYTKDGKRKITPRQMRRLVKKAGADPTATVDRDNGMGYSRATQNCRVLVGFERPKPQPLIVEHAGHGHIHAKPVGTGRGHHAVDAWTDEAAPL